MGSLGCTARAWQVQARLAQSGGATSVPALPASRTGASREEKKWGEIWARMGRGAFLPWLGSVPNIVT